MKISDIKVVLSFVVGLVAASTPLVNAQQLEPCTVIPESDLTAQIQATCGSTDNSYYYSFVFANGDTAVGCHDDNNVENVVTFRGVTLVNDVHISCSDEFLDGPGGPGFGEKGSPVAAAGESPVASYVIAKYKRDGGGIDLGKTCCDLSIFPTPPPVSLPTPAPVPTKPSVPPPTLPPEVCDTPDLTSPIEIPDNCNLSSNKYYYRYVLE
jgi:hypothetical protein